MKENSYESFYISFCVILYGVCIQVPTLNLTLQAWSLYRTYFQLQLCIYEYIALGSLTARTSDSHSEDQLPEDVTHEREAYCLVALPYFRLGMLTSYEVNCLRVLLPHDVIVVATFSGAIISSLI
jgi:hypothetical protein